MKIFFSLVVITSLNIFSNEMNRVDIDFDGEPRHYLIYEPNNDIKTNRLNLLKNLHNLMLKFSSFDFIED